MTPKSLLRHKRVRVVPVAIRAGHVLPPRAVGPGRSLPGATIKLVADDEIKRVVLCTGKVYYDLLEEREKRGIDDIQLLRLEQLYPFPARALIDGADALPEGRDGLVPGRAARTRAPGRFVEPRIEAVLDTSGPSAGGRAMPGARPRRRTAAGLDEQAQSPSSGARSCDDAL